MATLIIGVTVGDNYIDAVTVEGKELISKAKHQTTDGHLSAVQSAVKSVVENSASSKYHYSSQEDVINCTKRINIGTTQFESALRGARRAGALEATKLQKVGVLRLCGSASLSLPPFTDFPEQLKYNVYGGYALVQGGFEFTQQEISTVNREQLLHKVSEMWSVSGTRNFVICGIFSPLDDSQENEAAEIIRSVYPNASVTVSNMVSL